MICISLAFSVAWVLSGWAAVSRYSMLGCFRAAVQFISFETIMSLILLIIFVLINAFNYELIVDFQAYLAVLFFIPTVGVVMLFAFFMETNRPPFDLSEAESDVVAGYNTEYSGILFGLFYLGEYLNLFAACTLLVILFCGG
jgi:NADH-quinone oxidoreductase subunit H